MDNNMVTKTIIKADPGYFEVWGDSKDKTLWKGDPIIAWGIHEEQIHGSPYYSVFAITQDGYSESAFGVLNPNGTVTQGLIATHDSMAVAQQSFAKGLDVAKPI